MRESLSCLLDIVSGTVCAFTTPIELSTSISISEKKWNIDLNDDKQDKLTLIFVRYKIECIT